MKLTEAEAVEFLREWAREGFPRRVDQSLPTDVLVCLHRLMDLPEGFSIRRLEEALAYAGPDADFMDRHYHRTWEDIQEDKRYLA